LIERISHDGVCIYGLITNTRADAARTVKG
jgi:hypothetical protein